MKDNECCPSCKDDNHKCFDNILTNGRSHKIGDYWTLENDPCTHCSCNGNNRINCFVENCTTTSCGKVCYNLENFSKKILMLKNDFF